MKHVGVLSHVALVLKDLINEDMKFAELLFDVVNLEHLVKQGISELILS